MLDKHFTTIMSVICIMILLMAVTRTEASPVPGNGFFDDIFQISIPIVKKNTCHYFMHAPCVLPDKKGSTVTCLINYVAGPNTDICPRPIKDFVFFNRLSNTEMGMKGLDVNREQKHRISQGEGRVVRYRTGSLGPVDSETKSVVVRFTDTD
eukprot:Nk52_evm1s823 gene=Nk52_evmTU1s823